MRKLFYFLYRVIQNPDGLLAFLIWIVLSAVGSALIALIVAFIAASCDKDFEEWFKGAFGVLMGISILIGAISFWWFP